jgi:putative tryptophan/tyrosine transport system substrate-binding protein
MKRRDFITLLGGAAVGWPFAARAQQDGRVRRIGWLSPFDETDSVGNSWMDAFKQGLAQLGWVEGRNLRFDIRRNPKAPELTRVLIAELIALQPDVLVSGVSRLVLAIQQQTQSIPIVFLGAGDPINNGVVSNISHPGGNTTGVTDLFSALGGKWLEIIRECAPNLVRVGLNQNPEISNPLLSHRLETTASAATEAGSKYGVTVIDIPVRNIGEIERSISAFAAQPGGGLIVLPPPLLGPQRKLINGLAIRYGLPVIYQERSFVVEGGLLSYGTDMLYMFGHDGPPYVDRILRGAKPGDLPVQFPTKFVLTVNLTTAKAMGLTIPESLLARADELIE